MGAAHDYLERKYGVALVAREPRIVSVGTTATELVRADADRLAILMLNVGTSRGVVGPTPTTSWPNGVLGAPQGGSVFVTVEEDGDLSTFPWFAANETAMGDWMVVEFYAIDRKARVSR